VLDLTLTVITLCGSTRFKKEFEQVQKELTLDGYIVISVGLFGHSGDNEVWENMDEDTMTETKIMLDDMHKRKIDMAESIYVVNPGGYIGDSTWSEICYAHMLGKGIKSLEEIDEEEICKKVKEHIKMAEELAWQQLDGKNHNKLMNENTVSFKHKGVVILDPWVKEEVQWNDYKFPWPKHDSEEQKVNPFRHYGKQKVATFIEEINMKKKF